MVFLILTKDGIDDAMEAAQVAKASVWVNADLIEPPEVSRLCAGGLALTTMTYPIDPLDCEEVEETVNTIREHHPGEVLLVEWPNQAG
jgi:hypothetical protein